MFRTLRKAGLGRLMAVLALFALVALAAPVQAAVSGGHATGGTVAVPLDEGGGGGNGTGNGEKSTEQGGQKGAQQGEEKGEGNCQGCKKAPEKAPAEQAPAEKAPVPQKHHVVVPQHVPSGLASLEDHNGKHHADQHHGVPNAVPGGLATLNDHNGKHHADHHHGVPNAVPSGLSSTSSPVTGWALALAGLGAALTAAAGWLRFTGRRRHGSLA